MGIVCSHCNTSHQRGEEQKTICKLIDEQKLFHPVHYGLCSNCKQLIAFACTPDIGCTIRLSTGFF